MTKKKLFRSFFYRDIQIWKSVILNLKQILFAFETNEFQF